MTALALAKKAYASGTETLATPRSTEYGALTRVTQRMIAAARHGRRGFVHMAHAIHDNRRLWTILAADVADPNNELPDDLRARIIYLAQFTDHHSRQVLKGEADVLPLIEVNRAVMRGLQQGQS